MPHAGCGGRTQMVRRLFRQDRANRRRDNDWLRLTSDDQREVQSVRWSVAMRRFLLAAVMCGCGGCAQAADMPDLPILRGGFTEGLTSTSVNWQGFYVGGQGGYGSSDAKFAGRMRPCLPPCSTITSSSRCRSRNGISASEGQSARSAAFGAFVGYNSQWDDVVVGVEVNYMHGTFGGTSRATKELVSGSGAVRRTSSTTLPSIHRRRFRCRTWRPSARAPPMHGAASCPTRSAALRWARPTSRGRAVVVRDACLRHSR